MTTIEEMGAEPWRFDFFTALRRLERSHPERPKIGDAAALRDEYVSLGQNPFMDFPASNLSKVERLPDGRLQILVKFLGLLGPQGALPMGTTEEALFWVRYSYDDSFPRFLDLLNHRFLELFFRAWADSRPIAHSDRPKLDRFKAYVGSTIGIGTLSLQDLDQIPDPGKLDFAGIAACQAKSASRLCHMVRGLFGVDVEIDEFVDSRLAIEPLEQSRLGSRNSQIGADMMLGAYCFSVEDKFRIRIFVKDMAQYVRFLPPGRPADPPTGDRCEPLVDLVFFYLGETLDWEVELALPTAEVKPVKLGGFGQVGWTTWIAPDMNSAEPYRCDARFHPADRMRERRQKTASGQP